jgi:hypothetical protein
MRDDKHLAAAEELVAPFEEYADPQPSVPQANRDDGPNMDDPENILDPLAVLGTAVREAHAQICIGMVRGATLRRVHDAALRVIGAARNPLDIEEGVVREIYYLDTMGEHVYESMDRLAEKLTMPSGGINDASPMVGAEGGDAPYRAPAWAPCAPNRQYSPNVDNPDDVLDLFAALDAAVRDALPQIRGGTVRAATLTKVHDAALRVIGAARDPADIDEAADRGLRYLETLLLNACYGMDRVAEKFVI